MHSDIEIILKIYPSISTEISTHSKQFTLGRISNSNEKGLIAACFTHPKRAFERLISRQEVVRNENGRSLDYADVVPQFVGVLLNGLESGHVRVACRRFCWVSMVPRNEALLSNWCSCLL